MSNEDLEMVLWNTVIFEHQRPFTEDDIAVAFVTKIMDILADAGLLKKTLKNGEPFYHKTSQFRSPEQANEIVKAYIRQKAKRLGIKL